MMTSPVISISEAEACKTWLKYVRADGPGFMLLLGTNDQVVNRRFKDNTDALSMISGVDLKQKNVFITPGQFASDVSRYATNANSFNSLFIDVDCGPNKAYTNKKEALSALQLFCSEADLPIPSLIIDSGWGVHVYWCFQEQVSVEQWRLAADNLKKKTKSIGLQADMAVTADPARVMRVPGSLNLKQQTKPKPVKIIHPRLAAPKRYKFENLLFVLDGQAANSAVSNDSLSATKNLMGITVPDIFPEGTRNTGLLTHAGHLRAAGFSQGMIESELLTINANACKPPLSEAEVLGIARRYQDDSTRFAEQDLFVNNQPKLSVMSESQMITALNQEFAWDLDQMQLYSLKTGRYVQKPNFITQYSNKRVNKGTLEEPKLVELGKHWLSHPNRRDVPEVVMLPGKPSTLANGAINSWRGYSCIASDGDVEPFESLLKHLIKNEAERHYVLSWLASLIKDPAAKFNVALVVWSYSQGSGKSLLFESVGRLFDSFHFGVVGQEVFTDSFTDWQANKVYVICDEVSSTGARGAADRVKGWVTAQTNRINVKYEPKIQQRNLIKYVFLSNHPDAVFMEGNDRRFYVVEASQDRFPPQKAKEYLDWFNSGGRSALLNYLSGIDTSNFNPAAPAPVTHSKQEMIDDNKTDLDRWLDAKLPELEDRQIELVSADSLATEYALSSGSASSGRAIGLSLKKRGFVKLQKQARFNGGNRKRLYASRDATAYECLSDSDLASAYEEQHQTKSNHNMQDISTARVLR